MAIILVAVTAVTATLIMTLGVTTKASLMTQGMSSIINVLRVLRTWTVTKGSISSWIIRTMGT